MSGSRVTKTVGGAVILGAAVAVALLTSETDAPGRPAPTPRTMERTAQVETVVEPVGRTESDPMVAERTAIVDAPPTPEQLAAVQDDWLAESTRIQREMLEALTRGDASAVDTARERIRELETRLLSNR